MAERARKKKDVKTKRDLSKSTNIKNVKKFYQYLDSGKHDELKTLFDSEAKLFYESSDPITFDELVPIIKMFYSAFPDFKHVTEDIFTNGNKVVVRQSYTGTFKNSFMGFDPNGLSFKYVGIHIFQFKGGKISAVWAVEDELGMMTQLGLELRPKK
jgi:predicted ester cyclase